ncbi:acyltransferase [Methanocaldococcus sp.]
MIHPTAIISKNAKIGKNVYIGPYVFIQDNVIIGDNCKIFGFCNLYGCKIGENTKIGTFVEIQKNVEIGKNCKIQSHSFICEGVKIGNGVFIGHGVVFINDKVPRAVNEKGELIKDDWELLETVIEDFVSIGSGSVILPVKIGKYSLIGAGSIVTKDIPQNRLVYGTPAKIMGIVCSCGNIIRGISSDEIKCNKCGKIYKV